ncbi:MAG TPA: Hsp20/alpha crystallin family protein [Caulobacteraceae bacterium]|nr:Hsp20/alpha crystallin family protein [Caulobacteraceae bacterium]
MADTPQTPQSEAHARAERQAKEKSQQTVEGEPRSFRGDGEGESPAAEGIRQAGEAGRQLADTGRRAGREVMESWRSSFEPFQAMQMEFSRLFDDAFRQFAGFGLFPSPLRAARPFAGISPAPLFGLPATDVKETDAAHVLAIELPGLSRDDVDITLDGDVLTVSGHKSEEREDGSTAYRVSERRYGRFERSFPIPPDVQRSAIEAEFKDGLLKITLPRDPAATARRSRIEIKG